MKAVLALAIIYVGTFLIAIRGASPNSAQASQPGVASGVGQTAAHTIDPAKEADIRSLIEIMGVSDADDEGTEQFHRDLLKALPEGDQSRQFVDASIENYRRRFDSEYVTDQLISIYDRRFSADEIKELLQFYSSPLGEKFADNLPQIIAESESAKNVAEARVASEVLHDFRQKHPATASQSKLASVDKHRFSRVPRPTPRQGVVSASTQP